MKKLVILLLRIIGVVLLLVGLLAAYYGPLEIFVFYLFSDGGRFHYAGFGMGSFWFASLVVQNIGYYLIAALFIPVGIGHVRLRRWALSLTQLYLWFWLGAGLILIANLIGLVPTVLRLSLRQDVLVVRLIIVGVSSLTFLLVSPLLALGFYRSAVVRTVFEEHDANLCWTERYPFPLLSLLLLFVFMILVMHIAIFFQGLFPWFGQFMLGRQSVYIISFCIVVLGILIFGFVKLQLWAWWGSLGFVSLLSLSTIMSFTGQGFFDIIQRMNLPTYELVFLEKLSLLHDIHLVAIFAPPLLIASGLVLYSKRYFGKISRPDQPVAG